MSIAIITGTTRAERSYVRKIFIIVNQPVTLSQQTEKTEYNQQEITRNKKLRQYLASLTGTGYATVLQHLVCYVYYFIHYYGLLLAV